MLPKDIVIIGGGHNGLVAAAYLAREGHQVRILEARPQLGGAASTNTTLFPGKKVSEFSYLNSLMLSEIVRDLDLKRFGYEVLLRNPSSFTPCLHGPSLLLGPDMAFNQAQIAQFSPRDAEMYPLYEEQLGELGEWMAKIMTMIPSSGRWPPKKSDLVSMLRLARHVLRLNPVQMLRLRRLLFTDPVKYLDAKYGGWFESDVLIATLITDAMIGATKLSGYVLLHHVMGEAGGARGIWGYSRGGMGGISKALEGACREHGVKFVLNAQAERIVTAKHRVSGVLASIRDSVDGAPAQRFFPADIVISAVNPTITFGKLLAGEAAVDKIRKKVLARDCESASMKINLILKGVPNFRAMPGTLPGPQHQGTIHIAPSVEYVQAALRDYEGGMASSRPILEITIPSVVDETLAPAGSHVMNIFLQFYPYSRPGEYWQEHKTDYFWDTIMPLLREYISNIDGILEDFSILTPRDIERELGMIGGNIFHGGMGLDQLGWNRPAPGCADYRVLGINGLYLSGAGTHPGGGVCGAPGYNAARVILSDL
jgi:phytoene dehydrogenase-like protein